MAGAEGDRPFESSTVIAGNPLCLDRVDIGPLVTALSGRLIGRLRVPVTIVPGSLSYAAIDAIT